MVDSCLPSAVGTLCRAYCTTVGEVPARADQLCTAAGLNAWLLAAGLLDEPCVVTPPMLAEAHQLRAALTRLLAALQLDQPLPDSDRRLVNTAARHPPVRWQLDADWHRQISPGPDPLGAALATVAADGADLITDSAAPPLTNSRPRRLPGSVVLETA